MCLSKIQVEVTWVPGVLSGSLGVYVYGARTTCGSASPMLPRLLAWDRGARVTGNTGQNTRRTQGSDSIGFSCCTCVRASLELRGL